MVLIHLIRAILFIGFKEVVEADIASKIDAPGGAALLKHVGYLYVQEAKKGGGGVMGFFAEVKQTGHVFSEGASMLRYVERGANGNHTDTQTCAYLSFASSDVMQMQKIKKELERVGEQDEEVQKKLLGCGVNIMWKMGKLEVSAVFPLLHQKCLTNERF